MPCRDDWKACAVPWKLVVMVPGRLRALLPVRVVDGLAQRNAGLQVEGDGDRGQLAEVVDGQRAMPRSSLATALSGTSLPVVERM